MGRTPSPMDSRGVRQVALPCSRVVKPCLRAAHLSRGQLNEAQHSRVLHSPAHIDRVQHSKVQLSPAHIDRVQYDKVQHSLAQRDRERLLAARLGAEHRSAA